MTTQQIFLYPSQLIYEFFLSLLGFYSFGYGVDLLSCLFIGIVFWQKTWLIFAAIIRRITGFERG